MSNDLVKNSDEALQELVFSPDHIDPAMAHPKELKLDKRTEAAIQAIPQDTWERLDWLIITGQAMEPHHMREILQHLSGEMLGLETIRYYLAREYKRLVNGRHKYLAEQHALAKTDFEKLAKSPVHARYAKIATTLSAKLEGEMMREVALEGMDLDRIKDFAKTSKEIQGADPLMKAKDKDNDRADRKEDLKAQAAEIVDAFTEKMADYKAGQDAMALDENGQTRSAAMNQSEHILENVVVEEES
jgi:hypothetical protein